MRYGAMTRACGRLPSLMLWLACVCLITLGAGCMNRPREPQSRGAADGTAYGCFQRSEPTEPMVIDGSFTEASWKHANAIDTFVLPVEEEAPEGKTAAKMTWDQTHLYVAFRAIDEDIWSLLDTHDATTYREDALEIFLKPDPDAETYYNFEINAKGTVMDAYHVRSGAPMAHRWRHWNCDGLKVAVKIVGTLNHWEDRDEYWQLEVAIPFAALPSLNGVPPQVGDRWSFLLARCEYSVYLEDGCELSACARLSEPSFHAAEEWMPLLFAPKRDPFAETTGAPAEARPQAAD